LTTHQLFLHLQANINHTEHDTYCSTW